MDKYEYKIRADEIKELIAAGEYVQAAEIADTIDWRRVKSVMMLCTISDLYKINRRYEDAKNMLLLAYERRPGGKTICYSLCELCIKTEEYVQAINYYKEFVQAAPKDPGRYILQYKLYEAQDVGLEERIGVLEELKKRDYREKWAYELAYLYHRVGLATRCVEECDELILWFGEGKYVIKAMELKMLHEPLTESQQEKYSRRFRQGVGQEAVQTAESGQEVWTSETVSPEVQRVVYPDAAEPSGGEQIRQESEEMDIQVKTMDVGEYNTINLQAELAAGLKEVLAEERRGSKTEAITRAILSPMLDADTESLTLPEIDEVNEGDFDPVSEVMESTEIFFGATSELGKLSNSGAQSEGMQEVLPEKESFMGELTTEKTGCSADKTAQAVMEELRRESVGNAEERVQKAEPPKALAGVLSQESDGQIRIIVPEKEAVEKQITGQMSIEDILLEWEKLKKDNEAKRQEEIRQHVLEQTGTLFTEFEAAVRDGLLEQLEIQKATSPETTVVAGESEEEPAVWEAEEKSEAEQTEAEEHEESEEEPAVWEAEEESEAEQAEAEEHEEPEEEPAVWEAEEESEAEQAEAEEHEEPEEEPAAGEAEEESEAESPVYEENIEREKPKVRALTREEKELYAPFIQSRSSREKLVKAVDSISLDAYTGNIIITGEEGMDTLSLAKNMIREVQMTDSNFSGKVAKISGQGMNTRNIEDTLEHLKNGALIIQKASRMEKASAASLCKKLQKEDFGIIVVMEDTRKAMAKLLKTYPKLQESFTARMDVEAMSNDSLASFGRLYAKKQEYSIDELGMLALHTRIAERQTIDHVVTVLDVREIIEGAIRHANRKTLGHFFDILFAKRYDDEDMIVLTEKDFV